MAAAQGDEFSDAETVMILRSPDTENRITAEFEKGLVSVIIPTYNRARFIWETLQSVLSQSYRPMEVLIIDDGSTDNTAEVVEQWQNRVRAEKGLLVKYFYQVNMGPGSARNYGLLESRGQYIQFLDSDDLLSRNKISAQIEALRSNLDCQAAYCAWRTLFDGGIFKYGPYYQTAAAGSRDEMLRGYIADTWFLPHHSYLFTRTAIITVGPWDTNLVLQDDADYLIRMLFNQVCFKYVPSVHVDYRRHLSVHVSAFSGWASSIKMKEKAYLFLKDKGIVERYRCDFRKWYQTLLNKAAIGCGSIELGGCDDSFQQFINVFSISANIGKAKMMVCRIARLYAVRLIRHLILDAVLVRIIRRTR